MDGRVDPMFRPRVDRFALGRMPGEETPPDDVRMPVGRSMAQRPMRMPGWAIPAELGLLVAVERGASRWMVVTDVNGSPRVVADSAGNVVLRVDDDAFGRILSTTGTFELSIGFAGGIYDPITGLVRFGMRDYDPEAGRWTAKDPSEIRRDSPVSAAAATR